uniref:Uncharacterized protein n=1 Tax=Caenorhabditis japonica TaxID=281687 RepID=A0A8R1ELU9_CAEJA
MGRHVLSTICARLLSTSIQTTATAKHVEYIVD